jgi:hypothetical protein
MPEISLMKGDEIVNSQTGEKLLFEKLSGWPNMAECRDSLGDPSFPLLDNIVLMKRRAL